MGQVELNETGESICHPAEHIRAGSSPEAPALGALDSEPALTDEAERVLLLLCLQLGDHDAKDVVRESAVDARAGIILIGVLPWGHFW